MERGNREQDHRLGPGAASLPFPTQPPPPSRHHHQLRPDHAFLAPAAFEPAASQLPATSYAASNAQAVAANAADVFASPPDPVDFYRSYHAAPQPFSPTQDFMATAPPAHPRPSLSLRSNGGGASPKHAAPAPAGYARPRPALRSASNPVDDRAAAAAARQGPGVGNGYSGEAQTSVKDLKKRFDQTTAPPPPSRKPTVSRNPPRDLSHSTAAAAPPANGAAQPPYPTMRAGSVREPRERVSDAANGSAASRTTQRPKFLPEDHQQPSSNPQSFASRINQPRTSISANEQASKSMTHLSPQTSPRPAPSSPGSSRSNGLLFGEILPEQKNTATVGYGIDGVRPRRTSESNLTSPTRPRFPSDANADDEPPPRDWYRGMASPRGTRDQQTALRIPTNNSRTHSDAPSAASQPQPAPPPSSRLPLSVKKVTSPPGPSSPVSTGSNSPALGKRPSTGRTARQHHQAPPPTARAKTPTKRSATPTSRSKSSAHATSSSRKQPPGHITTPGNNRLNAYITAPPPKLSPPLRSSRPRQTVSSASTTSSRMKAVDRGRSPHGSSSRQGTRREESAAQKRKIEIGPVDFAQRRETIRLAYSKSIRETEARVARQAAAERRKREAEAAALREKAEAEAEAAAQSALVVEEAQEAGGSAPQPTLALSSTHPAMPSIQHLDVRQSLSVDSPTLGLPGTFPNFGSPALEQEEIPQSAISAHSAVTEFDTEAQTEPPVPESKTTSTNNLTPNHEGTSYFHEKAEYRSPFEGPLLEEPEAPPCEDERHVPETSSAHEKATYRYPFEDDGNDEDIDVKISLDTSASGSPQRQYELDMEPIVPGSFRGEFEAHHAEVQADSDSEPAPQPQSTEHDEQQRRYGPGPEPEEYEPQPFRSDSFQTTVTIVSRDSDFTPSASFSRQDSAGQTETQMDSLEHFYVGPSMRENVAALRDSTFAPSEFSDETPQTSAEIQRTPDTSNSLTIPSLLSPANRSSQQSGWTDFSMDSSDGPEFANKEPAVYGREHLIRTRSSLRRLDSRPGSIVQEPKFDEAQYSPELSPLDQSKPLVSYPSKHRLPELDTGDGFLLPYLADAVTSPPVPQLPDHDPPPVPTPDGRRTPSSGYYDQTRPSSYVQSSRDDQGSCSVGASRRGSEDYVPPMSTPHSVDQMSVDMSGQTVVERYGTSLEVPDSARQSLSTEKQEPPSKERSRLTQRQMVIRELIDTEAIFVRDMNIVEEIYKGTAEACPKLDPKTIKLIFRNTDEIITFHTAFLSQLKDSVASVYAPKGRRSPQLKETKEDSSISDATTLVSIANAPSSITLVESDDARDRQTSVGPVFAANVDKMRAAHEGFLRTSDPASKRLINIQEDPTVKVWLSECNEVAKDLTAAWNLDSLLIKPMQRITKYPNLISQLLQHTPADHPDREALLSARTTLENAILDINKTKKNFELVGQIVGRKRKESDVRAGFARAFGKRVDKLQATSNRLLDDPEYLKLHEKFGDDYLRLQVVLRDVEFYTRQVSKYVRDFLQYLSAMELVMRLQASPHPELEAKWALFNVSMRDMEKVALDQHLNQVRKHVIEPFELVIKCYGNPSLAMKKRAKRRLDYERAAQLKKGGKKVDKQLSELVEQYEALNETLKKELPKLSANTEKIGNICLGNFVNIQARWYDIWKEKVKVVLEDTRVPELSEIVTTFQREFKDLEEHINGIGILHPTLKGRTSQSTIDEPLSRTRSRPAELSPRGRGLSINSDLVPMLPTPDFVKRHSGQFITSPGGPLPSPQHYYYRDVYAGLNINGHSRGNSGSPITGETPGVARPAAAGSGRPSTGQSFDSSGVIPRPSIDSTAQASNQSRRDSMSTYNNYPGQENRRFSGLFHSALPLSDETEEGRRSSRASSRERAAANGYNILWLAASLFEFNIETAKHEAGYPYLTYQAGEIFDVIAEKGELWLAKNQDDPKDLVGWIWSKHFAKLADS